MRKDVIEQLTKRNSRIIDAIIKKSKKVCPDSIALIGIGGSFCTGDIHAKSDLDLYIVINDDNGWKIASCFILGNVAHDVFCTPWERLNAMSAYSDPYVTMLLDLDIVYCADEQYKEKYLALRNKVQDRLRSPFSSKDMSNVTAHFDNAMKEYGHVMLYNNAAECKYASARMACSIEYVMYLANKTYVKRGIRRIPAELSAMKKLPKDFLQYHSSLVTDSTVEEIKSSSTSLMNTTREFVAELKSASIVRKEITLQNIDGTYEEIYSNWRNKMYYAAEHDDAYLSLMTAASCQKFYDEISDEFNVRGITLFDRFTGDDLLQAAKNFDIAMGEYKEVYSKCGKSIRYYSDIDAFEADYLQ